MLTNCVFQMRNILLTATHASSPSVLRYDVGWLNGNQQPHVDVVFINEVLYHPPH